MSGLSRAGVAHYFRIGEEYRSLLTRYGKMLLFRGEGDIAVLPDRGMAFEVCLEGGLARGEKREPPDDVYAGGMGKASYVLSKDYRDSLSPVEAVALVSRSLRFQFPRGPGTGPRQRWKPVEYVRDQLPASEITDIRNEAFRTRSHPSDVRIWRAAAQMQEAKRIASELLSFETCWLPVDARLRELNRELALIASKAGIDPRLAYRMAAISTRMHRIPRPSMPDLGARPEPEQVGTSTASPVAWPT